MEAGPRPTTQSSQNSSPLAGGFVAEPRPALAQLRRTCPVAEIRTPAGRPVWVVTAAADVRAGLLDRRLSLLRPERGPAAPENRAPRRVLDRSLVEYDPPDHTRIRRLAAPALAPALVEAYRPAIEASADALLSALAEPPRTEFLEGFARPFVLASLCEVFGIHPSEAERLRRDLDALFERDPARPDAVETALDDLDALVRAQMAHRRDRPGPDVISRTVAAWRAAGDADEDEVASLLAMLLSAGYDSTVQGICLSLVALLAHPDQAERFRQCPHALPHAVDELLRWDSVAMFATERTAVADVPLGGGVIPSGSAVLLSIGAANRDPHHHDAPDRLDLGRPEAARQLSFGLGPHYCPGSALARLEIRTALAAVLRHWPRVVQPAPYRELPWSGGFQHRRLLRLTLLPHGAIE